MMDNLLKTLIYRMARITHTKLSEKHFDVLEYAFTYYKKNRVGPLYQNLLKHCGVVKDDIESLFPHGLNSIYTWVGIPIQSLEKGCKPMAFLEVDEYQDLYLDYNGTTFIRDEVIHVLREFYEDGLSFGNPSSSTNLGRKAYETVNIARNQIAKTLGVASEEITFVSCGSEANNLAIKGLAFKHWDKKGHIITSLVEHPSVLSTIQYLEKSGFDITYLGVGRDGVVDSQDVSNALRPDTILVSVMVVNNEIGTINPVSEIGNICKNAGVPFMSDGIQAYGKIELRPAEQGISLLSLSGHKIYAPKGVAALYVEKGIHIAPLIHGGKQELGLRSGTENVGGILALSVASQLACKEMEMESKRLLGVRNYFLTQLNKIEPDFIVNGSLTHRIPNNLNIGFPDIDSGSLLLSLNQIGIYVSSGSACSAGSEEESHVIKALGVNTKQYGLIRFSFGIQTTEEKLEYLFHYLPEILKQLRNG